MHFISLTPSHPKFLPYTHGHRDLAFLAPSCKNNICPKYEAVSTPETRDGDPHACPSLPPLTVIDIVPPDSQERLIRHTGFVIWFYLVRSFVMCFCGHHRSLKYPLVPTGVKFSTRLRFTSINSHCNDSISVLVNQAYPRQKPRYINGMRSCLL